MQDWNCNCYFVIKRQYETGVIVLKIIKIYIELLFDIVLNI